MAENKIVEITERNAKHAYELLEMVNKSTGEDQIRLLKKYGSVAPLSMLLPLNFSPRIRLGLPPGMPPYKRDEATHPDLFSSLGSQIKRLISCLDTNPIKKMDKERVFIQVLENINPGEADLLCACKDKALTETYPNVTAELVASVFPHYIK